MARDDTNRRVLTEDVVRPRATGARRPARIRKWPGKTIPYYESIPTKWDWSLDRAIDHWNSSGAKIKFVEVPRKRAKLVIGYGQTSGADGVGTLGYQARNYVRLATRYKRANEFDPETRVWVGRLFAHELGHVLGFDHTSDRCSLMIPVYNFGTCPPLPADNPGYYHCQWIDKKLLRRFITMYRGRAKRPAALCLIEALPGELRNVTFTGGNANRSPVRVTWLPPTRVLAGTKVFVTVWRGSSCGTAPRTWERRVAVDPAARGWTDPAYGQGLWCYLTQIANRYGAARPATGAALARYAPTPAAPVLSPPTWRRVDGGWRFVWRAPHDGMRLVVLRDPAQPQRCLSVYDESRVEWLTELPADAWSLDAAAPQECLNLFVVTDWQTVSPPTQVQVVVPETPAAPTVGPRTWDAQEGAFRLSWSAPDQYTSLMAMRNHDDPSVCPVTYDVSRAEPLYNEEPGAPYLLYATAGRECISLFAETAWGSVSAPTQITTQVPAPTVTPTVGPVGPYAGDPSWAASANIALPSSPHYSLGIEVTQGACPAQPSPSAEWIDGFEDWDQPGRWYWYPEPYDDTGVQCVMFAAVDNYGQPGPVVSRSFAVPGWS